MPTRWHRCTPAWTCGRTTDPLVTRAAIVTRVVKPLLYATAVVPCAWIVFALATGRVDGDQVKFIQHTTGLTVLVSLFVTLSVTPLRRLTGWNEVIRTRRLIGLTAFWYALLHFLTYIVFDQSLSISEITKDVAKHPWVLVGFSSFLMLVPLAVTSTDGWIRRLGGTRWRQLHSLVYPVAAGGVLHFLWLVKKDVRTPLYFAAVLAVLLALRFWIHLTSRRAPARASGPRQHAAGAPVRAAGEDAA
jgi:sulfoxide reductase heme-binding subunit YedZ